MPSSKPRAFTESAGGHLAELPSPREGMARPGYRPLRGSLARYLWAVSLGGCPWAKSGGWRLEPKALPRTSESPGSASGEAGAIRSPWVRSVSRRPDAADALAVGRIDDAADGVALGNGDIARGVEAETASPVPAVMAAVMAMPAGGSGSRGECGGGEDGGGAEGDGELAEHCGHGGLSCLKGCASHILTMGRGPAGKGSKVFLAMPPIRRCGPRSADTHFLGK